MNWRALEYHRDSLGLCSYILYYTGYRQDTQLRRGGKTYFDSMSTLDQVCDCMAKQHVPIDG